MTKMLASISSLEEAEFILNTAADIIDLKQPEQGALGALPADTVKDIVQRVRHIKPISATIGDLPMQAELVSNAVRNMSKTGVNYIKIGFFPEGDWQGTAARLEQFTQEGNQLIAVLFADTQPDFQFISVLKNKGFTGVMLDTMNKSSGSLLQLMPLNELKEFVQMANNEKLLCGLAGSLKAENIPQLLKLNADYLGFRGALCADQNRTACLNPTSTKKVLSYFQS